MMNYEEARISLGFYADRIDLQCLQYRVAVSLEHKEKKSGQIDAGGNYLIDQATTALRKVQKEATILGILINQSMIAESSQLIRLPKELIKLLEANNRFHAASRKAWEILEKHGLDEPEKRATPKGDELVVAVQRLQESLASQKAKSAESTPDAPPEET
jgi:hypothetical protein